MAVHIPEFLFGMTFLTLAGRTRYILAPLLLAGAVLAQPWDGKITCALAGAGVFILLALAAPLLDRPWPRAVGAQLAKISYAVFLVHHVLIQELAAHFDLAPGHGVFVCRLSGRNICRGARAALAAKDAAHRPCRPAPLNIKLCPLFPQKQRVFF